MADTFTYPNPLELRVIEQELLPRLIIDDDIFDEFPLVDSDKSVINWEQEDNYTGLQNVRGMNGLPGKVNRVGAKKYEMRPGVYGDWLELDEQELTDRRALGKFDEFISLDDMVGKVQSQLLVRRLDRIRKILWDLLTAGLFTSTNDKGQVIHTDTFPLKTASAAVAWATTATATPFADIRAMVLKQRGQSVTFQNGAKLYMNQKYVNYLMNNTNANDMFGKRLMNSTINSLKDVNVILGANDLPEIVPMDRGYNDDTNTFVPFIPDAKGVLVGKRLNGAALGEFRLTRNANNPKVEGGAYTRVIDRGETQVPRKIEVHDGFNGGPVIFYPGAVVSFSM